MSKKLRKKYIVGNWKMNQQKKEIDEFFDEIDLYDFKCESWIAGQAIHLQYLLEKSAERKQIKIGVQDVSSHHFGAFTGETSAVSAKDLGAHFTLIGHSERRSYHKESNELLKQKIETALGAGLKVIYCVGETLKEREANQTFKVIEKQLHTALNGVTLKPENFIIAYEPVWAIGTGKTATAEIAGEVHMFIRKYLKEITSESTMISILYGGSVKPSNISELLAVEDIDGALVGGASLKANDFSALCQAAN